MGFPGVAQFALIDLQQDGIVIDDEDACHGCEYTSSPPLLSTVDAGGVTSGRVRRPDPTPCLRHVSHRPVQVAGDPLHARALSLW